MLSLHVHFSKCNLTNPDKEVIGSVNHCMFYVSDSGNNTIHRIDCITDDLGQYSVDLSLQKYNVPRHCVGEGFRIGLTPKVQEWSGAQFADVLSQLDAPPLGEGGCQWWILANLVDLEDGGYVDPGTTIALLADKRMDSDILMEFEDLRNELHSQRYSDEKSCTHPLLRTDVDFTGLCAALTLAAMKATIPVEFKYGNEQHGLDHMVLD